MTTLCIFAKAPVPGQVKTRLARDIGEAHAAALAAAFVHDTYGACSRVPGARVVLALDGDPRAFEAFGGTTWPPEAVWPQPPGDLGVRLEAILGRALSSLDTAFAVGADSPGVPPAFIQDALQKLMAHEAVWGPAADGGFYLLGLRRFPPGTLSQVRWSTPAAGSDTEMALVRAGLTVARATPWFDIDDVGDLWKLCRLIDAGELTAPRTRHLVEHLNLRP